ncbi:MAG: hypothetical protein QGH45_08980 [Myxococcota bacterium]|nr:hypothetical protein [Myxococcota bacterium]
MSPRNLALPLLLLLWIAPRPAVAGATDDPAEIDEEAGLAALEEHDPQTYKQLIRLRDGSDASYRSRLEMAYGKVQLREQHPDWFTAEERQRELEAKVDRKVAAYKATEAGEREALHAELLKLSGRIQDCRLDAFRLRIATLELRLGDLQRQVQTREQERDEFVERWLERRIERGQ